MSAASLQDTILFRAIIDFVSQAALNLSAPIPIEVLNITPSPANRMLERFRDGNPAILKSLNGFLRVSDSASDRPRYIAFSGHTRTVIVACCLVLPQLEVLVARLSHQDDWECLALCGALLHAIRVLQLVMEPMADGGVLTVPDNFFQLYSLLHRVERLNLLSGAAGMVPALLKASSILLPAVCSSGDNNWNACPNLSHIDFERVEFSMLARLVTVRAGSGYRRLTSFSATEVMSCSEEMETAWYISEMISRTTFVSV
ncbi:hypothetical protein B0H13DRAFT_1853379 [Mycena leptocephala]|nr:hypothetical protein B0H13DRAFT_1853379 [Mycena leptocephala]